MNTNPTPDDRNQGNGTAPEPHHMGNMGTILGAHEKMGGSPLREEADPWSAKDPKQA